MDILHILLFDRGLQNWSTPGWAVTIYRTVLLTPVFWASSHIINSYVPPDRQ